MSPPPRLRLVPPPDRHTLVFNGARYQVWGQTQTVRTTFADGACVVAAPEDTAAYRVTARFDGCGTDTWLQCVLHDALHLWAAQLLSCSASTSVVLRAVATDTLDRVPEWQRDGEESLVRSLTRYLLTEAADPWLLPLVLAGVDLPAWRQTARALLLPLALAAAPGEREVTHGG